MRADVGEPGLDLGDPSGLGGDLRLRHEGGALSIGLEHDFEQACGPARRLLGEALDAAAPGKLGPSMLGRELAGDHAKQSGLAGAVAADESHPGAAGDVRRGALDEKAPGDAHRKIIDDEHCLEDRSPFVPAILIEAATRSRKAKPRLALRSRGLHRSPGTGKRITRRR